MRTASSSIVGATTVLTYPGLDTSEEPSIVIVDVSSDRTKVVVTGPVGREEGTPASALHLAARLRAAHGDKVSEFCAAIERAVASCIVEEQKPS